MLGKMLGFKTIKCPGCKQEIVLSEKSEYYGIKVNCCSEGEFHIPGMLFTFTRCHNPFCEWSNVPHGFGENLGIQNLKEEEKCC